jgi:hypothetical protein
MVNVKNRNAGSLTPKERRQLLFWGSILLIAMLGADLSDHSQRQYAAELPSRQTANRTVRQDCIGFAVSVVLVGTSVIAANNVFLVRFTVVSEYNLGITLLAL